MTQIGKQLDIFADGRIMRDAGIQQAISHADEVCEKWSEKAYQFLLWYIKRNKEFMTEDVRNASAYIIEIPPSERAWGGVIVRAVKAGLIKQTGYRKVANARAHMANAATWQTI